MTTFKLFGTSLRDWVLAQRGNLLGEATREYNNATCLCKKLLQVDCFGQEPSQRPQKFGTILHVKKTEELQSIIKNNQ